MTQYLTIRSDGDYSRYAATDTLTEYLHTLSELVRDGSMAFCSSNDERWVHVVLAECDRNGNYAIDEYRPQVNVVEVICRDDDSWNLAVRIAAFLGSVVVDDHAEPE